MTPLERQLRRQLAGLRNSLHRTRPVIYASSSRQKVKLCRAKADRLLKEMRQLRKQIETLAKTPCEPTVIQPGRYRHHKGKEYEVIGIARHSETLEELVVYRALYGDHALWVRPRKMFEESVVVDGRAVPRFEFVGQIDSHHTQPIR